MNICELKHKLRQLKKIENKIRFGKTPPKPTNKLIWDSFFSTKDVNDSSVKYCMNCLMQMERTEIKAIIDEYFFHIYYQVCKETGGSIKNVYDPNMLKILGLPPYSSISDIKKRFRELAKIYHPDLGGESEKMIELLDVYDKLLDN